MNDHRPVVHLSRPVLDRDLSVLRCEETMNRALFSSASDNWSTPEDFFRKLDAVWHFDLDVCALPENAKCARYFTPEQDGLSQKWGGGMLDESSLRQSHWPMGEQGV